MTTLLLIASLTAPPSPELLARHRANVANWWLHTPTEDRAWRETEPVRKGRGR